MKNYPKTSLKEQNNLKLGLVNLQVILMLLQANLEKSIKQCYSKSNSLLIRFRWLAQTPLKKLVVLNNKTLPIRF